MLRREGLADGAVDLFANEAEDFGDAEVGLQRLRVHDRGDLAAGVEILREARRFGVGEGRGGRVVLVVILERERVFGIDDVVDVGDGLVGDEIGSAGSESVFGEIDRWREAAGGWDQKLAVGELVVEKAVGHGIDVAGSGADDGRTVAESGKLPLTSAAMAAGLRSSVSPGGHDVARAADFLVGVVNVLVAEEAEELIFDDGSAESAAGGVAMLRRNFIGMRECWDRRCRKMERR